MNKTYVDDMLIEMITPKVKEIEEKFTKGEGLSQDDINTLLLKSQYNHINHLDQKLDETIDSVKALEGKFTALEAKFTALEGKFELQQEKLEHIIQKSLNKNMLLLITVIGLFLMLSKIIDKF